jgi:xylan 1,4-beta-xylosidase
MAIEFRCDWSGDRVALPHVWERVVGSCHAPLALRADYQAQLRRCHTELGMQSVRFHGLLSDDMGTLICQDHSLLYSFFNADQIWDFLLDNGMRPFVELSFMPTALASGNSTVFRYKSNVTPPRDMAQWAALVRELVAHWRDRYGLRELQRWHFEVWNEPNMRAFWRGSREDYLELYRHTALAIQSVDPSLRVGGPATAKNAWIEEFLAYCEEHRVPVDFVSTHHYPTDALGTPTADTEAELARTIRGVLREEAQDARRRAGGLPLLYTEWNSSSNPRDALHDEPYAAAFAVRTVLGMNGLVDAYSFWTFSDLFEENYFPSIPFHGGFGLLTLHGIAKPSYRAFQLLHRLGEELVVPVDGLHDTVDCWVAAGASQSVVLLTNHALPRHPIRTEHVRVRLGRLPPPQAVRLERIDEDHAHAKRLWLEMGSPPYPSREQLEGLHEASLLVPREHPWRQEDGAVIFELDLPPHGVAAISLDLGAHGGP